MKKEIAKFETLEDALKFVKKASDCNFDIDIKYNNTIIDGKSILGVTGLCVGKQVEIICHTDDAVPEELLA